MTRLFRLAALMLASCVLAACASSPAGDGKPRAVNVATSANLPPPSTGTFVPGEAASEYHMGPNDLLGITVFQVAELSQDVRVNSRGYISLPLVGAILAGGKTVQELETEIATKLAGSYMQNPQVTVFVKEYTSQRVTVEGSVNKPGIFPLTGRTTLLQTIAMAQGTDQLADEGAVVVFRVIEGKKMAALFDIRRIRHGQVDDPLIYGEDIVVVDRSGGKSLLKGITDTLRGFVGFRTF